MEVWAVNPEYPKNLIKAIFPIEVRRGETDEIAEDCMKLDNNLQIPAVEYLLCTFSERDHDLIHYRYLYGMSKTETAKILQVSRSRIDQLEFKILMRLRHSTNVPFIRYGVMGVIERERNIPRSVAVDPIYDKSVKELNLNARARNPLWRNGSINTVGDIVARFQTGKIDEVRGLGEKNKKELYEYLIKLGIPEDELEVKKGGLLNA